MSERRLSTDETAERSPKRARTDDAEEPAPAAAPPPPAEDDAAPLPPPPTDAPSFSSAAPSEPEPPAPRVPSPEEEEEEEEFVPEPEEVSKPSDLYLDTINREMLDFDFEKLCSVTLSSHNVYACLVDGKYFKGRGKGTPAYLHSINEDKHVYLNLETKKFYVLPDNYEVSDPSLSDILQVLDPSFPDSAIPLVDSPSTSLSYDLHNVPYLPGYIGLNNMRHNDFANAAIHALVHVKPIRDFFLAFPRSLPPPKKGKAPAKPSELVNRFAVLTRKIWNPKLFKAQVSPHEFLQEVANASEKRFQITQRGDPLEFMGWLLNQLHRDLGGGRKKDSSIIYKTFQGEVRVETQKVLVKEGEDSGEKPTFEMGREIKTDHTPFLFLAVDLPPPPVFQDSVESNIIPQIPLSAVLAKYDGETTQEFGGQLRRFKITRLPQYLILHLKRFTKNKFVEEKNPTIVNFPIRGVDLRDYADTASTPSISTVYDLVANITHESTAGTARDEANTAWKVHLRSGAREPGTGQNKWFQMQDLIVEEINRQMIFLGESYVQIWERRDDLAGRGNGNANRDVAMKGA